MIGRIDYTFKPKENKIVFKNIFIVDTSRIQYIYNSTKNSYIYTYSSPTMISSDSTNIVTVDCTGSDIEDTLEITYDFVQEFTIPTSREIIILPVPEVDSTVNIITTQRETIISFEDVLTSNFTLNVTSSISNLKGDRVYIMLQDDGGAYTVSLTGNIVSIMCGSPESTWTTTPFMAVIEGIFDGINYTGIDNC